ncbi:MAG: hypothetical protein US54_C0018G0006 [Candidatus Roizmanbacteria bacterium GW2011_GWA2_37_7]|uniref:Uncharacterized protein n=1 Tax=Candidatus Roizmanbacteria bacterium GW2011_GWA2_37_7 TaxID=1618481 RepID=A0A0G0H4D2_9BACT|nr:MAG: hypothetical protein US54_C0018G0006 [Candidatus Roizmanbacteria bacterium GW2011_GWA2_37_7]
MIAPDTQQNLFYTIYFLVTHNALVILYSSAIFFVTAHALWRPRRGKILLLWGFIILLFAFEYDKHILEPLQKQTIESLITQRESVRIEYYITKFLTRVVPFGLPVFGWMLVAIGIFFDRISVFICSVSKRNH